MSSSKIALKLYAKAPLPKGEAFIAAFHEMIRKKELSELMVDVVDYGHVHDGPRVLFVGHEGDYAIDHGEDRPGLAYQRKRAKPPGDGSFAAHLADALRRTLDMAARLEREPTLAGTSFGASEVLLRVADRLNAPNTAATFDAVRTDLQGAASRLWGEGATVTHEPGDGAGLFAVRLRAAAEASSPKLSELLARVSA
jgi:hypothetical protein